MKASVNSVNRLITLLTSDGSFNQVFKNIQAIDMTEKCLTCKFKVTNSELNSLNTLHGGYILGAVDFISTIDLIRMGYLKHVSVNLATSFMKPGNLDSWIITESYVRKKGKRLAFCEVSFMDEESKECIASGTHIKCLLDR